jgi:hypothetical protein
VRGLGEYAGVGLQLGSVGGSLFGEEIVEDGGAVVGGLVVDDPEDVVSGGAWFGSGTEDAIDTDRDGGHWG